MILTGIVSGSDFECFISLLVACFKGHGTLVLGGRAWLMDATSLVN